MTAARPNILVIVIDRLNAGYLGPYGNTWVETPALNRFASQALTAEFAFSTSPDLAQVYRSYWQGLHPLAKTPTQRGISLPAQWSDEDRPTVLITDESLVSELPEAQHFEHCEWIPSRQATAAATIVAETNFAELIAATIEQLQSARAPFAYWVHSRGLSGPWDAPLALRDHLRGEEDPESPTFIAPPDLLLANDYDPDELLDYSHAYAAQVMAIDECLESLFEAVDKSPLADNTLVAFTSPRGYLLGQQRLVGQSHGALLADQIQVPLMLRYPQQRFAAERWPGLCEPRDLHHWLATGSATSLPSRDRVLLASRHEQTLRTPAWHLRTFVNEPDRHELYAKPDDRYEVNDVAGRCQPLVEQLRDTLTSTAQAIADAAEPQLAPLAAELVDSVR